MEDKEARLKRREEEEVKELEQILTALDKYHPTIPDSVTDYYLRKSGFHTTDPRVTRLVSVAAQKFIADIAHEALAQAKIREMREKKKDQRHVMTSQDIAAALQVYNVRIVKPENLGAVPNSAAGGVAGGGGT